MYGQSSARPHRRDELIANLAHCPVVYADADGWSGTLLYNVVGRRITEAGYQPFEDVYEQPRHLVDLSLQAPVTGALSLRADARNLLDDPVVLKQGAVTRLRYHTGRTYSLGMRWQF